jgi:hypothetical protein
MPSFLDINDEGLAAQGKVAVRSELDRFTRSRRHLETT